MTKKEITSSPRAYFLVPPIPRYCFSDTRPRNPNPAAKRGVLLTDTQADEQPCKSPISGRWLDGLEDFFLFISGVSRNEQ